MQHVETHLVSIDRDVNLYYPSDVANRMDKELFSGAFVVVVFSFQLGRDKFPVRVLIDTREVDELDILTVARRRACEMLKACHDHVSSWHDG